MTILLSQNRRARTIEALLFPTRLVERRTSLRSVDDAGAAYLFAGRENKSHMLVAGHDD